MTRPFKQGLDYFSLDVNCDDKVKLIEAKFGLVGFGIWVKLLQIIYDNGYYTKLTERELLLYKNRVNADINLITDVVSECVKWGIFNESQYNGNKILTSTGIQKRFIEATKRRSEITIELDYWIIDIPESNKNCLIKTIGKTVNVCNNSKIDNNNSQSKVKEIKPKESIREEKNIHGEFSKVKLTQDEYDKLVERFGKRGAEDRITKLDQYIASKGDHYKSHYATILVWEKKNEQMPLNAFAKKGSLLDDIPIE